MPVAHSATMPRVTQPSSFASTMRTLIILGFVMRANGSDLMTYSATL